MSLENIAAQYELLTGLYKKFEDGLQPENKKVIDSLHSTTSELRRTQLRGLFFRNNGSKEKVRSLKDQKKKLNEILYQNKDMNNKIREKQEEIINKSTILTKQYANNLEFFSKTKEEYESIVGYKVEFLPEIRKVTKTNRYIHDSGIAWFFSEDLKNKLEPNVHELIKNGVIAVVDSMIITDSSASQSFLGRYTKDEKIEYGIPIRKANKT